MNKYIHLADTLFDSYSVFIEKIKQTKKPAEGK